MPDSPWIRRAKFWAGVAMLAPVALWLWLTDTLRALLREMEEQ